MFQVEGWALPKKVAKEEPKKKEGKKKDNKKKSTKEKKPQETKRKRDDHVPVTNTTTEPKHEKQDEPVKKQKVEKEEPKLTPLQLKMREKLSGSRFRWINEQLYTIKSAEAVKMLDQNPEMFEEYHNGFRSQVQSWPENPVNTFVKQVKSRLDKPVAAPGGLPGDKDGTIVFADMGCGEAQLALDLSKIKGHGKSKKAKFEIHSFDLKAANDRITKADIKHVPMEDESCHVVVFCLALMGTNFLDFIKEGLRILKPKGEIWIAEIKSRFVDNDLFKFIGVMKDLGLLHKTTDDSNKMFVRFEFFKPPKDIAREREQKRLEKQGKKFIDEDDENRPEGEWLLKPCIYKRR